MYLLILDGNWKTIKPNVDHYLTVWNRVKKNSNMHWEPVESPKKNTRWMPWLCGRNLPKSGITSEKARNHGFHLQWEVKQEMKQSLSCGKNNLRQCWTHQKFLKLVYFVKQNINSHGNFERIDDWMCNSYKIKYLLHKLILERATGRGGIFAEHIFYADSSVCDYLSSLFKMCFYCMETVIVNIYKNKNGDISDAGNYRPVSLATIVSKLFEHYILPWIPPFLATTDNQFGFKPKHGTDMCIFCLNRVCRVI